MFNPIRRLCWFVLLASAFAKDKPFDLTLMVTSVSLQDESKSKFGCGWTSGRSRSIESQERIQVCHVTATLSSTPDFMYEFSSFVGDAQRFPDGTLHRWHICTAERQPLLYPSFNVSFVIRPAFWAHYRPTRL